MDVSITKKDVTCIGEGIYNVIMNMKYSDKDTVLIDQDFSEVYKKGQKFGIILLAVQDKVKKVIRQYEEQQAIFKEIDLDTGIASLNKAVGGI